jgi:hypothetical protein
VTSRDIEKLLEVWEIVEPDYVRERATWVRGEARIDGDEIVLNGGTAERYMIPDAERDASLLFDLAGLVGLGEIAKDAAPDTRLIDAIRWTDTGRALEFAKVHGLLWHGPARVGKGEVRESLKDWHAAGWELSISAMTYSKIKQSLEIRQSQKPGWAEPVRSYLRMLRDEGFFKRIAIPDDDDDLLKWASIQLAERISRGMADCTPTLSAVGEAGDFRFGNAPDSLVGAANYQLALFVSRKKLVRECEECRELFLPTDPRQREHKKCGNRKRKRKERQKQKAKSSL